ncbi:MAG TPA: cob(I)yrinic acid a,c-diamide adenosyltransferase [Candidatus Limnocylindrales bacterium]|nr:cob(I)yrinic acid a,c-diamide adenosyltransferase [Candidatus Limnocylindrales bacterium]
MSSTPSDGPFDSAVATRRGDDGTTGLLFGGDRIAKDDVRTEAYGTIDEAVAALGVARAQLGVKRRIGTLGVGFGELPAILLRLQRELFVAAAELATREDAWDRQVEGVSRVSAAMVDGLETMLREAEAHITMPSEFVVPGETVVSAALEVARTVVRRAERRAVTLGTAGLIPGPHLLPYLNRLADLLWVLARAAEQAESRSAPPSRPDRRRSAASRSTE